MVTPSEVCIKKATWISAQIDVFLSSRSNVCAISSASFNATRPFCFMLVTVLRASTPVLTYVVSIYYVTILFNSLFRYEQENISSKIGLILSFSLILIWGARLPVVCGSSAFAFHFSVQISASNQVRIGRIAGQYAKPRSSSYEKVGDAQVLSFRYVIFLFISCPTDIAILSS